MQLMVGIVSYVDCVFGVFVGLVSLYTSRRLINPPLLVLEAVAPILKYAFEKTSVICEAWRAQSSPSS
jgi:hypothetical protein